MTSDLTTPLESPDINVQAAQPPLTLPDCYTDAPRLHPNLLLGSLQLLFWLLVHPSAWHNHIARIDPTLRPDFYLVELTLGQWRNPALQQVLLRVYIVWPLLLGLMVWVSGIAADSYVFGIPRGIIGGIVVAIAVYLSISLVGGMMVSVAMGVVSGVTGSLAYSLASTWPDQAERLIALIITLGLALGAAGSATFTAANAGPGRYPLSRQISGLLIGILLGSIGPFLALSIAFSITSNIRFGVSSFGLWNSWVNDLIWHTTVGVVGGIAAGITLWRRIPLFYGVILGLVFGLAFGPIRLTVFSLTPVLGGIGNTALISALFALCYVLAERVAGPWVGAVAGALGSGGGIFLSMIGDQSPWPIMPVGVGCILAGLTLPWWRPLACYPLLLVWNWLLYQIDRRRVRPAGQAASFLRWHAAFWDEAQRLPFINLDEHLLLILTRHPAEGQLALNYLSTTPQRGAAQAAQIELDARNLEACAGVVAISQAHYHLAAGELAGPASALLRSFSRLSQDVAAALRQESIYNQRLALSAVEERLDGLLRELTRSDEPYAGRFRPAVTRWRELIGQHGRQLAATAEVRQEIDNPYIIGIPLTEQQEVFTGRTGISARIEQLLRDQRRPPLFLYGQRRMGKTSLLNNLGRLLPNTIVPLFVDLQGASSAGDHAGLLYRIAQDMIKSASRRRGMTLPSLALASLGSDPFTRFEQWLDEVEATLAGYEQSTALLALDEFETLERAMSKGRYDEADLLGMLRHLIQHRPRFKVLLAGSHPLAEFHRWAGYLINVQVIHIGYLQDAEALQLIEQPVKGFSLRYEPEASRQVLALTHGHPFLVQLLCSEIVALKNEQDPSLRRLAQPADVAAAVPAALASGSFFFADIERNQVDPAGLAILQALATQGRGASLDQPALRRLSQLPDPELFTPALDALLQRELIEALPGGYRFQVELIRQWFGPRVN